MKFKGILHKIAMPMMVIGVIGTAAGALSVVWLEWAHNIIYVGSTFIMMAALFYVIYAWDMLIKEGTAGIKKPNFFQKMGALLKDPLKFGPGWQMVFMNFTVSGVGIFLAVKLEEIFRVWPHREERITLTGHWHILAALVATIILMYFADLSGLKGKVRQWFGWSLIIMSDIAFASATIFSMKRLFVDEISQQGTVNTLMLLIDLGLGVILIMLFLFMLWRLYDLFQAKGYWHKEFSTEKKLSAEAEIIEQKLKLEELNAILKEVSK
jgi:divalent metal cation (Fe/Co/Zn/Cd) transporter